MAAGRTPRSRCCRQLQALQPGGPGGADQGAQRGSHVRPHDTAASPPRPPPPGPPGARASFAPGPATPGSIAGFKDNIASEVQELQRSAGDALAKSAKSITSLLLTKLNNATNGLVRAMQGGGGWGGGRGRP